MSSEAPKGTGTRPSKKDNPPLSEPIPVDVRPSRIRDMPELEDIEMAEETHPSIVGQNPGMTGTENTTEKKRGTRQPLIQQRYDAERLMKTMLSAPVTIPIGEFMAYSTELRKQLIRELQNRTVKFSEAGKTDTVNATENVAQVNLVTMEPIQTKPLVRSELITIEVSIGSESKKVRAKAIVDSGSEINIVCQELAHELNKSYSITPLKEISCSDANGNLGLLSGQFGNVRLEQGPVVTNAALFIGNQKISFQLLLGCPWLRGNLVSISERLEGTYLVYHDPRNPKNYKELFVLEEDWKKETAKQAVTHLARTGGICTNGAWKIDAGQEIVILGEPKRYTSCMLVVNETEKGEGAEEDQKTPRTPGVPTNEIRQKISAGLGLKRQPKQWFCAQDTPAVRKIRQSKPTINTETTTTHLVEYLPSKRTLRVGLIALRILQSHVRTSPPETGILLTVPALFPRSNCAVELYNRISREQRSYPRVPLPIRSIYSQRISCQDETKMIEISWQDVHECLAKEIRSYEEALQLGRKTKGYKGDGRRRRPPENTLSHQNMPAIPRDLSPDRAIRSRLRELIRMEEPELTPVLPANDVPHPTPLSHSSDYFPLPSQVSDTLHEYLHESLYHPAVTSHANFHAAVLTSKHALRLELAHIRGHKVQRTHAFDATLAELQGPDGLPVASRLGQAMVIFFPEENNYDCLLSRRPPSSQGRDDESVSSSSSESSTKEDEFQMVMDTARSYPRAESRLSSLEAVAGSTTPPTVESSEEEEGEVKEQQMLVHPAVHPSVIRARQALHRSQAIGNMPRIIEPASNPHLSLPPTFAETATRLIAIKRDKAQQAFHIPNNYSLAMRVNEAELRRIMQGLAVDTTIKLGFVVRTLVRLVNTKGVSLLLHNPVFLTATCKMLFPGRLPMLDEDSDEADENSREFSFSASLFQLGPAAPGDNLYITESDSDSDMPPLASVSDSSESDEESETDSERDEDGVPGRGVFQLQAPGREARRNEGQEMMTSNYLPAGPSPTMSSTQSPLLFQPPTPIPDGTYCPPPSPSNCETNGCLCENQPHVYLTCVDMPFESPSLTEIKIKPDETRVIVPSEVMMPIEPCGIELYTEDHDVRMDDVNKEERVLIEELQQELVLRAAKTNIMLPEYVDSISSSDMSESESDEDYEEHTPLKLSDLLWANLKNSHYVLETVHLSTKTAERLREQPYEPYYYVANSALSYLIQRHNDHLREACHYEVLENGTIPAHVFHHVDNPLEYAVVEMFRGIRGNSPLYSEDNSLLSAGHTLYDGLRGHDEWKIAVLGVKIHRFMRTMDVRWNHWEQGDVQLPLDELDRIQQHISLAHEGWHMPGAFEAWQEDFEIRDISDSCAKRRIMRPDSEEDRPEELVPRGIVFTRRDVLTPYQYHIRYAKNYPSFAESCTLFNDGRPLTFLDPQQSPLPEAKKNPWMPVQDQIRIARLGIRRFLGLIYKQFLRQEWRGMVDTLSPQDDA
ncbi:uncharacterized protein ARMOST_21657 [Armillaria ostoyae]|uniref:Uncharacterized protein n=1 Tax=Armillaria ostoyae TaxID=47428 RepID=A0A284SAU2_ARMOS|nr:uncharacterized protein ARMOST_21657 [Armillaria ostoyae]